MEADQVTKMDQGTNIILGEETKTTTAEENNNRTYKGTGTKDTTNGISITLRTNDGVFQKTE